MVELIARKPIAFILISLVVIFFLVFSSSISIHSDGFSKFHEQRCEFGDSLNIINCDVNSCDDKQSADWNFYVSYLNNKRCEGDLLYNKDAENKGISSNKRCTCIQQKVWNLILNPDFDDSVESSSPFNFEEHIYEDVVRVVVNFKNKGNFFGFRGWSESIVFENNNWNFDLDKLNSRNIGDKIPIEMENYDLFKGFSIIRNIVSAPFEIDMDTIKIDIYFSNKNPVSLIYEYNNNNLDKVITKYDNGLELINDKTKNSYSAFLMVGGGIVSFNINSVDCSKLNIESSVSNTKNTIKNYDILCKNFLIKEEIFDED